MKKRLVPVCLLLAIACNRTSPTERIVDVQERDKRIASRRALVESLRWSCEPDDWATLVLIAAGTYDWHDGLDVRSDAGAEETGTMAVRCEARRDLYALTNISSPKFNRAFHDRFARGIDKPGVRDALKLLYADTANTCGDETPTAQSLAQAVVFVAPIPELLPFIAEMNPRALADRLDGRRPGPRAERIDEAAAELTPDGFARALAPLDPDYQWSDGLPPPSADEAKEIRQHALGAAMWLHQRTPIGGERSHPRVCEEVLRRAVQREDLGARVLKLLEHPDREVFESAGAILSSCPRPSSRPRLVEMARTSDDDDRRAEATIALQSLDRFEGKPPTILHWGSAK